MRTGISEKLDLLRKKLMQEGDEAHGPDGAESANAEAGSDDAAGDGGATNVSPADALLDEYISSVVADVCSSYEISYEDANDYVFAIAQELADAGELPEIPEYGNPKEAALWLASAKSLIFTDFVLAALESDVAEEE